MTTNRNGAMSRDEDSCTVTLDIQGGAYEKDVRKASLEVFCLIFISMGVTDGQIGIGCRKRVSSGV